MFRYRVQALNKRKYLLNDISYSWQKGGFKNNIEYVLDEKKMIQTLICFAKGYLFPRNLLLIQLVVTACLEEIIAIILGKEGAGGGGGQSASVFPIFGFAFFYCYAHTFETFFPWRFVFLVVCSAFKLTWNRSSRFRLNSRAFSRWKSHQNVICRHFLSNHFSHIS